MKPVARRRLTKQERQTIYEKCNGHCAYCGTSLEIGDMQVDHVVPLANRGTDTLDNMLPACRSCNHYKSTLTVAKFRKSIEGWPDVLMRDIVTYRNAVRFGVVEARPRKVVFYFERRYADAPTTVPTADYIDQDVFLPAT